jgi:hypothetical protein
MAETLARERVDSRYALSLLSAVPRARSGLGVGGPTVGGSGGAGGEKRTDRTPATRPGRGGSGHRDGLELADSAGGGRSSALVTDAEDQKVSRRVSGVSSNNNPLTLLTLRETRLFSETALRDSGGGGQW